jgi:hypothetical protein
MRWPVAPTPEGVKPLPDHLCPEGEHAIQVAGNERYGVRSCILPSSEHDRSQERRKIKKQDLTP